MQDFDPFGPGFKAAIIGSNLVHSAARAHIDFDKGQRALVWQNDGSAWVWGWEAGWMPYGGAVECPAPPPAVSVNLKQIAELTEAITVLRDHNSDGGSPCLCSRCGWAADTFRAAPDGLVNALLRPEDRP